MMGVYTHVFWDEKSIASNKKWLRSKQVPLLATFSHSLSHHEEPKILIFCIVSVICHTGCLFLFLISTGSCRSGLKPGKNLLKVSQLENVYQSLNKHQIISPNFPEWASAILCHPGAILRQKLLLRNIKCLCHDGCLYPCFLGREIDCK